MTEPMVVRIDFRAYTDADGYEHVDGWTFSPPEDMTRDDIAQLLTDNGFKRTYNCQDQDEPLNN